MSDDPGEPMLSSGSSDRPDGYEPMMPQAAGIGPLLWRWVAMLRTDFREFPERLAHAVPTLIDTLSAADPDLRQRAAQVLGSIGPAASGAVPALTAALSDTDWVVRMFSAAALAKIGPASASAVPELTRRMSDSDARVRPNVARALAGIGEPARTAVPELLAALRGASDVRHWAFTALEALRPPVPELMQAVYGRTGSVLAEDRRWALDAIDLLLPTAADPESMLDDCIGYGHRDAQRSAVEKTLRSVVAAAAPDAAVTPAVEARFRALSTELMIRRLIRALGDADASVRGAASTTLIRAMPRAGEVLARLLHFVRKHGVARIPEAEFPEPELWQFAVGIRDEPSVRNWAGAKSAQLGIDPKEMLEAMVGLLGRHGPYAVTSALDVLGGMGPAAAPAIEAILRCLREPWTAVSRGAAAALGKIASAAAVEPLRSCLNRDDRHFALIAAESLATIDASSDALVIRTALAALSDSAERIRTRAVRVFELLGSRAAPAMADLEQLPASGSCTEVAPDLREAIRSSARLAMLQVLNDPIPRTDG